MKNSGVSWIGDIPNGWTTVFLGSAVSERKNKNKGLQESNLLSLSYGRIIKKDINASDGLLPESFEGYNIVEKGDVVLRLTDLQNDQHSLRVGLVPERGIITSAYVTLANNNQVFLPSYLYYALHSFDLRKGFYGLGSGVRQGLNLEGVRRLALPRPSLSEQNRIVTFLDKKCAQIDRLIAVEEAQIQNLGVYKESSISCILTGRDGSWGPLKRTGIDWIGDVASRFDVVPLKFLLAEPMLYGANETGTPQRTPNDFRYIRITDIESDGTLKNANENQYLPHDTGLPYSLEEGDILFARSGGTVGKTFLFHQEYGPSAFAGYLIKARCDQTKLLPEYLYYFSKSSIYNLWKDQVFIQATIQNIGASKYASLPIVLGSLDEQKQIVSEIRNIVTSIDAVIRAKQKKISLLSSYKKSLIYEYVTGKKEVF